MKASQRGYGLGHERDQVLAQSANTPGEIAAAARVIDAHVPEGHPGRAAVLEALGFAPYVGGCWESHNGHRKAVHRDAVHRSPA